jgi:hypothetical protein
MAGAPKGNQNGRKGKVWFDALRKEVVQRDALAAIATKVVDAALAGELWAIQEIGNRLDGKPAQAVEVSGPDGDPIQLSDTTSAELDARISALKGQLESWGALPK